LGTRVEGQRCQGGGFPSSGTILLQDKEKKYYCVACQELVEENPALNTPAAEDALPPEYLSALPAPHPKAPVSRPEHCEGAASGLQGPALLLPAPLAACPPAASALAVAEEALQQKIGWAGQELQQSTSIETSIQLCNLIRSCTESLKGLKEVLQ
uniref:Sjogren syndrome/scleroderma autoantigen 1 n=1 Tax=Sphenodon punctatus TaxID=8508 RepID=A0A8D0GMT4_SPHPU